MQRIVSKRISVSPITESFFLDLLTKFANRERFCDWRSANRLTHESLYGTLRTQLSRTSIKTADRQ